MKTLLASLYVLLLWPACFSQTLTLTPVNANGTYSLGSPIAWNVSFSGGTFTSGSYTIGKFGGTQIASGTIDLTQGGPQITAAPLAEPATLLAELKATPAGGTQLSNLGGAIAEQDRIRPTLSRPADFDSFWASRIAALNAIPMNTIITHTGLAADTSYYYRIRAFAPPTSIPPLATTMSPASNNVLATARTQPVPSPDPPPRVFYRLRVGQTH